MEINKPRIWLGLTVGSNGVYRIKTTLSLMNIVKEAKDYEIVPVVQFGSFISDNRNDIIKFAQKSQCSHTFFVDYDMHFSSDTLNNLLAHNKDIIGVNCNMRGTINNSPISVVRAEKISDKLFKCQRVGAGLILIKMNVFDKISFPYFKFEYGSSGRIEIGEDYYFCDKARANGFDIWCDPTIKVGHIGDFEF